MKSNTGYLYVLALLLTACSTQQRITRQETALPKKDTVLQQAAERLLQDSALQQAHVGISFYDPAANAYLYNYQGDKYFVPASNTKIATCYAAMKWLGDSLTGISYAETDSALLLIPAGDPTLLHPAFPRQPVIRFLQQTGKTIYIADDNWKSQALGNGWSWSDYNEYYMTERSPLPVYGNAVKWVQENDTTAPGTGNAFERSAVIYSDPEVDWKVRFSPDMTFSVFHVQRAQTENIFTITQGREAKKEQTVPFVTNGLQAALDLLPDTIGHEVHRADAKVYTHFRNAGVSFLTTIYSQPTDSMLRLLMHESDNFLAEQSLLMVSQQLLQTLDDKKVIDTLLKTDLRFLPQAPHWADGSGLSRYNLFTPQDLVSILHHMQQEFGMERIRQVFPTGGQGTLRNYFLQDSAAIYAKTGSLSGVIALSGFLYTRTNRLLLFSVLVNNHPGNAAAVRKKIEEFLVLVRNSY